MSHRQRWTRQAFLLLLVCFVRSLLPTRECNFAAWHARLCSRHRNVCNVCRKRSFARWQPAHDYSSAMLGIVAHYALGAELGMTYCSMAGGNEVEKLHFVYEWFIRCGDTHQAFRLAAAPALATAVLVYLFIFLPLPDLMAFLLLPVSPFTAILDSL